MESQASSISQVESWRRESSTQGTLLRPIECMRAKSLQSCLTLCDPMDCSPPGSSVYAFLQRIFLNQHLLCHLHWQVGSLPLVPSGEHRDLQRESFKSSEEYWSAHVQETWETTRKDLRSWYLGLPQGWEGCLFPLARLENLRMHGGLRRGLPQ